MEGSNSTIFGCVFFAYNLGLFTYGSSFLLTVGGSVINSVHTRCIVKTSGFTRGVCKDQGFY